MCSDILPLSLLSLEAVCLFPFLGIRYILIITKNYKTYMFTRIGNFMALVNIKFSKLTTVRDLNDTVSLINLYKEMGYEKVRLLRGLVRWEGYLLSKNMNALLVNKALTKEEIQSR